jgi:hypothetical protein
MNTRQIRISASTYAKLHELYRRRAWREHCDAIKKAAPGFNIPETPPADYQPAGYPRYDRIIAEMMAANAAAASAPASTGQAPYPSRA